MQRFLHLKHRRSKLSNQIKRLEMIGMAKRLPTLQEYSGVGLRSSQDFKERKMEFGMAMRSESFAITASALDTLINASRSCGRSKMLEIKTKKKTIQRCLQSFNGMENF